MKRKLILIICASLLLTVHNVQARAAEKIVPLYQYAVTTDTTVLTQILSLSLNSFIGKPVDSLLAALPGGYDKLKYMPAKSGYCKGAYLIYGTSDFNFCAVEIFVDTFNHVPMPNYDLKANWDINLIKRESIAFIKVLKLNSCVYGCGNIRYQ